MPTSVLDWRVGVAWREVPGPSGRSIGGAVPGPVGAVPGGQGQATERVSPPGWPA